MEIKTLGDFRRLTKDLDDDFIFDINIMKEVTEEQLAERYYKYPWDNHEAKMQLHDIGYSGKVLGLGIYEI